jgi:hypothetical protein
MTRAPSSLLSLTVFSFALGFGLSFLLLYLCLSDLEIACTLQMPAYRIAEVFGFGSVHGGSYLFGVLANALLFGAFCLCALLLVQRITKRRNPPE